MKNEICAALLVTLIASPAFGQQSATVAKKESATVVEITVFDQDGKVLSSGSGFIVRADGVLVSNNHVIDGASSASVTLPNGDIFDDVTLLDSDKRRDLVLLKIKALNLLVSRLGDSDAVDVGQHVIAIGNPEGLVRSVSDGIVSAMRQADGFKVIQVTAPVSPGSSGGPLFNDDGQVIGVTSGAMDGQNLNLAVPINYLKPLLLDIDRRTAQTLAAYNAGRLKTAKAPDASTTKTASKETTEPDTKADVTTRARTEFSGPISDFLDKQLEKWTADEAAVALGQPVHHRYSYDDYKSIDGDIFAYSDPTLVARQIELNFNAKTKKLRAIYLYPAGRMTWDDCKRIWGDKVQKQKSADGTKFYAYKDRRIAVLLDKDDNVINFGVFPIVLAR